jgi:hypothetical protein
MMMDKITKHEAIKKVVEMKGGEVTLMMCKSSKSL